MESKVHTRRCVELVLCIIRTGREGSSGKQGTHKEMCATSTVYNKNTHRRQQWKARYTQGDV